MAVPVEFTITGHAPDEATLTRMLDALYGENPSTAAWSVSHSGHVAQPGLNVLDG